MSTYIKSISELTIFENLLFEPSNFTDYSTGLITWQMNLAPKDDVFTFALAGTYIIQNESDELLYRLVGGKVFEIHNLDLKNADLTLLKECFKNVYDSLMNIFDGCKIGTEAEIFNFPLPPTDEILESRVALEIQKYK